MHSILHPAIFTLLAITPLHGQTPVSRSRVPATDAVPAMFIENAGQWPDSVRFCYRQGGSTAALRDDGVTLFLRRATRPPDIEGAGRVAPWGVSEHAVLALRFEGTEGRSPLRGEALLPGVHNFYIGNDPAGWATGVRSYGRLRQVGLRPGVDVVWQRRDGRLAYDLRVKPGAAQPVVHVAGARGLHIAADGRLHVETSIGALRLTAPVCWEETGEGRRPLPSRFSLVDDTRFRVAVDRLDEEATLVIDPGLDWSSFLGSSGVDYADAMRADDQGRIYVTGFAAAGFPTTPPSRFGGGSDLFVSCMDPTQSGARCLVWSTYVGGSELDAGHDIHVTPDGVHTTVVGLTRSANFPTTANTPYRQLRGTSDATVTQFLGPGLLAASTYLGGSGDDRACAIEPHPAGGYLVAGYTASADFPVTPGAYQTRSGGGVDVFAARVVPTANAPVAVATYIGGTGKEGIDNNIYNYDFLGADVTPSGQVVVAAITASDDFPTTARAFSTVRQGGNDIGVAVLDAALARLDYGTYIGSGVEDGPWDVTVDGRGDLVISGFAKGSGFPTTTGAFQTRWSGRADVVLFTLRPAGQGPADLRYSTYLGGPGPDWPATVVVESSGILVTCATSRGGLTTTAGAMQTVYTASGDVAFLARLDPAGSGAADLQYLSYFGGANDRSWGMGIAELGDGRVAATGIGGPKVPMTPNTYQSTNAGADDAWVAVFDLLPSNVTRFGASTPACAGPIDLQLSFMPRGGGRSTLICNDAPPGGKGLLIVGRGLAGAVSVLNAGLWVDPLLVVPVSATGTSHRLPLAFPTSTVFPANVAVQYGWFTQAGCAGSGPLAASDALRF